MLPHPRPRLPVGGEIFPIYISMREEIFPSLSLNRGIRRGESGIEYPLPSLIAAMLQGHHFVRATESEDSASDALCF
jgi:hypothetical protein